MRSNFEHSLQWNCSALLGHLVFAFMVIRDICFPKILLEMWNAIMKYNINFRLRFFIANILLILPASLFSKYVADQFWMILTTYVTILKTWVNVGAKQFPESVFSYRYYDQREHNSAFLYKRYWY